MTHAWPPAQPGDPVNWAVATLRGGMNRTQPKPSYVLPGNCTLGQLTEVGRQMQLRNGASLRAAYVGPDAAVGPLLPEGYATAADLSPRRGADLSAGLADWSPTDWSAGLPGELWAARPRQAPGGAFVPRSLLDGGRGLRWLLGGCDDAD